MAWHQKQHWLLFLTAAAATVVAGATPPCQDNWKAIGDSCFLLAEDTGHSNLSFGYDRAVETCHNIGGTLVDVWVCNGQASGRCSSLWKLQLEQMLLSRLQVNESVLLGASMMTEVSLRNFYWDEQVLRYSMRPWSLEARLLRLQPSEVIMGNANGSMFAYSSAEDQRAVVKDKRLCLSVVKVDNNTLRYRSERCDSRHVLLCRMLKFHLPAHFIICYVIWFALLMTVGGIAFRLHKASLLR